MTLLELIELLKKRLGLVIALPLIFALAMGAYSFLLMKNTYTASTSMYVLVKGGSESSSTLASDLSASQMVTNDVANLLSSDRVTNEAAAELGLSSLKDYKVSVTSETTSRVVTLEVTSTDADGAARVANSIADNVSAIAQQVMNIQSVNVIDQAQTPTQPSGPNRVLYVAVAFLAGLFVAVALVVLADMLNTKIRSQEELEELLGVPVIGRIPVSSGRRN
ncbi:YveK family protein [Paratractidigestivibacter sp.]|uniref:YveK family protein n=1 Tax=Paratractidigestivibacter sp. TaxID=2847316 RepID=UPI002ABD59E2|nr:Wzz/FepE/Etk N-terminal domain-containing protein [Paratractidigestivibacter sp.]